MFSGELISHAVKVAVLAALLIYNVYCTVGIVSFKHACKKKDDNTAVKDVSAKICGKLNIYIFIVKIFDARGGGVRTSLTLKIVSKASNIISLLLAILLIIEVILTCIMYALNLQSITVSNAIITLFGKSDCVCYAKCTGDAEDDAKTAYELLFGPTEYESLIEALELTNVDQQTYDTLMQNPSGQAVGEFIISHLNEDAVLCYKNIVSNNSGFRSEDGKDRSKMSNDELKADLIALLKDYKVQGVNPLCEECSGLDAQTLENKCIGEAHWQPGWTWNDLWSTQSTSTVSTGGNYNIDVESYGFTRDQVTIDLSSEFEYSYNIAYISDLHMLEEEDWDPQYTIDHNVTYASRRANDFSDADSLGILPKIVECINGNDFDAVVFGGDIADNYGEKTFEWLQENISKINNPNLIYLMTDHEMASDFTLGGESTASSQFGIQGDVKVLSIGKGSDELTLVGQSYSNSAASSDIASQVESALSSSGKQIFFSHVPIMSNDPSVESDMAAWIQQPWPDGRGEIYYWSSTGGRYNPSSGSQQKILDAIYSSTGLLEACFGHTHIGRDYIISKDTDVHGHIFKPAYASNFGVITVKGADYNTGGSSSSSGSLAAQNSKYGVQIGGEWFYWYHQASSACGCTYCGDWSAASWGKAGGKTYVFGSNGCAVYSLAIGISNLVGAEITPTEILKTLDSPLVNGMFTVSQTYFDGIGIRRDKATSKLASTYGLTVKSIGVSISEVDAILDQGGYVWGKWTDSKCAWCGNGTTHFMMIRKKEGDNYYCFTSCAGKGMPGGKAGAIQTMELPLNKQEVLDALADNVLHGLINPNKGATSSTLSDGLQQSAMTFFDACTVEKGSPVKELTGGVYLYDGLPWDNTGAYTLNTSKVNQYLSKYLGMTLTPKIASDDHLSSTGLTGEDGVLCADVAAPPILAFCDITDAGGVIGWGTNTRPKKMCTILEDNSGTIYYLPTTCVGDSKGHTWPGGLSQTFLSTAESKAGDWYFNSDSGHITGDIIGVHISDLSTIKTGYSSVKYSTSYVYPQLNLEVNPAFSSKLDNTYTVIGFISWK